MHLKFRALYNAIFSNLRTLIKIIFFLSINVVFIIDLSGQNNYKNGFIITFENDTIEGLIEYRSNSKNYKSCDFIGENGSKTYLPSDIIGYGVINEKFYLSQILKDRFVEVLVTGKISLYKSHNKYYVKKDTILYNLETIKEKSNIVNRTGYIKNNNWKGILSFLISDCLYNSNSHIEKLRLNDIGLTKLIVKYNICSGSEFEEFKSLQPRTSFKIGASVGISNSIIRLPDNRNNYIYLNNSYNSINPDFGIIFILSSPRINENIALQGEVHYIKSSYSSHKVIDGSYRYYYDTYISINTFSLPISLKYSIPLTYDKIYFHGGFNFDFHVNTKSILLTEKVSSTNEVTTYPEKSALEIKKNQIGYWGGIGYTKAFEKFEASLGIRYFYMARLSTDIESNGKLSRFSINLILYK
ncbi:hypothetical protein OO013_04825 [Mangrovivirga sp. M17]|uniref:Outer membrane protein beta-barrel domain-containing protein n=1 Tax=Mangrovivirga halotolerans TaxID=2993936 RepID=A0ABT3RNJ3_9BACT|nr:hypothetical protein [Mangrovivirga halotolerans]MCX2743175.1 hypothetical protein [Mangrovivirga halotolerans]